MEEMMRKFILLVLTAAFTVSVAAAAETYKDAPLIDAKCSAKAAADPDSHTRACALQCQDGGFGILTANKKFVKFDAAGNAQVVTALKSSNKKDHLRADVTGDLEGDTLKVTSFKLL
jgi:hypothetical protein